MANPTTNFGWVMPTSASLVTNLPADFNTFGQAVDTSMSELLGGTTGQVLSKTSGTNMDFTWVTPTDQTPLTTKGDLFTFSTVDARLGVGTKGQTLVADSTASTGLKWATPSSPAFVGCRLYKSANQSISNNSLTTVTWSSESIDTNAFHDTSTNTDRITIPTGYGGKYLVTWRITWNGATSGYRYHTLNQNAGATILSRVDAPTSFSASNAASVTMSDIYSFSAGDYINVQCYQNSGGAIDILSDAGFVAGCTVFAVQYLGA